MDIKNYKNKTIIISILMLIGVLVTIDLAYIYYEANFDKLALPSFCSVSDLIDCDGVAKTVESQFFGVPLAYWGLFLYSFIAMLLSVDVLKKFPFLKFLEVFKNKFHYIASLGIISFTISMILLCVSLFGIHKICVMCLVTYLLNLSIGIVAVQGIEKGFIGAIKQSWRDFVDALKPMSYRIAFILVMACAVGFLSWTYTSAKFSPALKFEKENGEFFHAKTNKYAIKGNVLGSNDKDAIVFNIYSDYHCPMCRIFDRMLHKAATKDFKNIRIEHHSMPLDRECNKYLMEDFHHGSCIAAQYAEAAHIQGKFWEVSSALFDNPPKTEKELIKTLKKSKLNLDMEKLKADAHSKVVSDIIMNDMTTAVRNKQVGTPVIEFGGVYHMGIPNGGYPGLKSYIKEHGGIEKHAFFK